MLSPKAPLTSGGDICVRGEHVLSMVERVKWAEPFSSKGGRLVV